MIEHSRILQVYVTYEVRLEYLRILRCHVREFEALILYVYSLWPSLHYNLTREGKPLLFSTLHGCFNAA